MSFNFTRPAIHNVRRISANIRHHAKSYTVVELVFSDGSKARPQLDIFFDNEDEPSVDFAHQLVQAINSVSKESMK